MMATRKRAAGFLLEKPLVSRLPFEVEQPPSIAADAPHKRPKLEAGEVDDGPSAIPLSETRQTQWCDHQGLYDNSCRQETDAVGVDIDSNRGCWLETGEDDGRRGDAIITFTGKERRHADCSEKPGKAVDELSAVSTGAESSPARAPAPAPAPAPATETAGPKRALVQLKIDAMFAAPGPAQKKSSERCGVPPGEGFLEGGQRCAEPSTKTEGGMDVDAGSGVDVDVDAGAQVDVEEGQAACYACRSGLGMEGGDILCSFCDRAACQGCWQKCFACEIPHCSLCLAADYSSQFECYFCPPCYQDRRLESR